MRQHAAVRIDFMRRERQHRLLRRRVRQSLESSQKEAGVADHLLEIAVGRHDVQHRALRPRVRGGSDEQRLGRRGETRHHSRRDIEPAAGDCRLEEGAKVQGGGGGHGAGPTSNFSGLVESSR